MGNSVIYRPAYDAEVEYLESTGTQYIDTGVYPNSMTSFELKETLVSGRFLFGCWDGSDSTNAYIITGTDSETAVLFYRNTGLTNIQVNNRDCLGLHTYSFTNKKLYIDNVEIGDLPVQTDTERLEHSVYLFNRNANGGPTLDLLTNSRIHSFQVTEGGVLIRDFIPVRIGSVGYLYDKVSKQLFANKGTGQFILGNDVSNAVIPQQRCVLYFGNQRSVVFERIYEEYEWLVGDGTARMRCVIGCNSAEWKLKGSGAASLDSHWYNEGGKAFQIVSDLQYIGGSGKIGIYDNSLTQYFSTTKLPINTIRLVMDTNVGSISINDTDFTNPDYTVSRYFELANQLRDKNNANVTYSMSAVKIDGSDRFYPCKLLQSIPAILDGNGIARQVGECGMWDKVSNRFYGNVANSGTFTVKGPKCYEEYKWLIIPYTQNDANSLPIKSNNFSYQYIIYSVGNIAGVWTENTKYIYYPKTTKCSIWGSSERIVVHSNSNLIPLATPFDVECNSDGITMNGELMPNYGSSPYFDRLDIYCYTSTGQYALSKITVDGSVRYVPCKLTHGIPASMDANGIARPAGTCGMWDKVNDKFYGNVASSGSFTVSND